MKTTAKVFTVFLLLSTFLAVHGFAQDQQNNPPDRVARLSYMEGPVSFEPAGESDWSMATLNYSLTSGDRLWTDANARAELDTGNVAMRMGQQTDLTVTNLSDQLIQLGMAQGSLRVSVYDLRPGNSIEVDTPNGAITLAQNGYYRVDTYPDQNLTLVTVNSGAAQVTGSNLNQTVGSGQAVQITGANPAQLSWVQPPQQDSLDQWSSQRDQQFLTARQRDSQYVSPDVPGYSDLDQYGSWSSVPQYGPVWYPSSVPAGWVPYRNGRWIWVEPWGWTWCGAEPWGFAPFHYGRWVQVGPRWGWLPGPVAVAPIYGPAFVAFVGGPNFSIGFGVGGAAAWFPLGPGEPFYPWYHYGGTYLRQINVTNVRNINITNINVTNINQVQYRYRGVATTAVSANVFRNSQPIMHNVVRVSPQELGKAAIIPHPQINPERTALSAGAAASHPPVAATRPAIVQHPPARPAQGEAARNQPAGRPNETARPAPNEAARPNEVPHPPTTEAMRPPAENRPAPAPTRTANLPQATRPQQTRPPAGGVETRPPLVSRSAPPPQRLPYAKTEPAMQQHPGRPLEPQQRQNIRQGQPAGPMQDREFPPHAGPVRPSGPPPSHGGGSGGHGGGQRH